MDEDNGKLVWIVLILAIIGGVIYFLYMREPGGSSSSSGSSTSGFSFKQRNRPDQKASSKSASYNTAGIDMPVAGPGAGAPGMPQRRRSYSWSNSSYYQALQTPLPPMKKSAYDEYFDNQIMPTIEASGFNMDMIALMKQAESNPLYQRALELIEKKNYKEAVEILNNLGEKTTNAYSKSLAFAQLVEIYRAAGDEEQRKKAEMGLVLANSKLYFMAFPGMDKKMKEMHKEASVGLQKAIGEKLVFDFKPPATSNR